MENLHQINSINGVRSIMRINSTGQLCVDEGWQETFKEGSVKQLRFVRLINPNDGKLDESISISPEELLTELEWDGTDYVAID